MGGPVTGDVDGPVPNHLADLERLIAGLEGDHVVDAVGKLLGYLHRRKQEFDAALGDPDAPAAADAVEKALRGFLNDAVGLETFEAADLPALRAIARAGGTGQAEALIASRTIASVLDDRFGAHFCDVYRQRGGRVTLVPGTHFPVAQPIQGGLSRSGMTTNPDKVAYLPWETRHLRIVPEAYLPFRLELDWALDGVLGALSQGIVMAIALPNRNADEDFIWDEEERDGKRVFFRVRPRDVPRQAELVRKLVERADAEGAQVLVLPELTVPGAVVAGVESWLSTTARSLRLVVAGTEHVEEGGRRLNRCTILAPGTSGSRVLLEKMVPAEIDQSVEDLRGQERGATIHMSKYWSLATLVCRDFLERDLVHRLAAAGLRLALVPAMTAKTDVFATRALELVTDAQAVVGVANVPVGKHPESRALLAVPFREVVGSTDECQEGPLIPGPLIHVPRDIAASTAGILVCRVLWGKPPPHVGWLTVS